MCIIILNYDCLICTSGGLKSVLFISEFDTAMSSETPALEGSEFRQHDSEKSLCIIAL